MSQKAAVGNSDHYQGWLCVWGGEGVGEETIAPGPQAQGASKMSV